MNYAQQLWDTVRSYLIGPMKLSEMQRWFESGTTAPGASAAPVNEDTALALSAVWNAVQIIAGSVGSLPLVLYKRTADGDREAMRWHPLYRILHDEPNPDMSAMDFRETMQAHALTWGNAFAEITRNASGQVAELWPIFPSRVSLHRDGRGLYYQVTNTNGSSSRLDQRNMLHVKGPSPDGVWGYSVIGKARQSLGYTQAAEHFGAAFYGNATIHGGVVKHPGRLSEQAHARLLHDLEARVGVHGDAAVRRAIPGVADVPDPGDRAVVQYPLAYAEGTDACHVFQHRAPVPGVCDPHPAPMVRQVGA